MGLDHKFFQFRNGPSPTIHTVQILRWDIHKEKKTYTLVTPTHKQPLKTQAERERERIYRKQDHKNA